ncbi:MAG TPA: phosphodiester glycosidase family protein [Chthoniobacterales bacterium]
MSARREVEQPFRGKLVAYFFQLVARLKIALVPGRCGKGCATQLLQKAAALWVYFSRGRRKIQVGAVFLFLALATLTPAQWIEKNSRDEDSSGGRVVHRHIDLAESETDNRAIVDLALFSTKSFRLRVIDNADGVTLSDAMRRTNCIAGINGGYFDPNFAPLGLRIIDGKLTSRLTRGRLMSGVLSSDNAIHIFRVAEFSLRRKPNAAIECGPFLVDFAKPVRGLEPRRAARRTFAATGSGDRAALGFCSDATLADLASILATPLGDFKIQRALNLDGGSSSAFWFRRNDGSAFSIAEEKTVRDFVGVTAR